MKHVTIRRCPVCSTIGSHADQLRNDLANDGDYDVKIVDGNTGEFTVNVDGRTIEGLSGDNLRAEQDLAAEIRGVTTAAS